MSWSKIPFRWKTILSIFTIELALVLVLTTQSYISLKDSIYHHIQHHSEALGSLFSNILITPLLSYDRASIQEFVEKTIKTKKIAYLRVLRDQEVVFEKGLLGTHKQIPFLPDFKTNIEDGYYDLKIPIVLQEQVYGYIELGVSLQESNEVLSNYLIKVSIMALLGLILSVFVTAILNLYLANILSKLREGVQKVAKGELGVTVEYDSYDELGLIVHSFNQMSNNLKDTQAQLVQSGKLASLGELSSGVAHELNNPLHFINGFNNRIKAQFKKHKSVQYDQVSQYIENINQNCERMRVIIQHFRDFSRQEEPKHIPIPINEVIKSSFILLNEQLRLKNIRLELDLAKENPIILGDANRLEQVFINLITNARDAFDNIHNKNKTIQITSKIVGSNTILEFKDNGSGIPQDKLEKIFNPFFTTKDVGKGTGLGLSISHSIITEHKGSLVCQSTQGQGTKFIITLENSKTISIEQAA